MTETCYNENQAAAASFNDSVISFQEIAEIDEATAVATAKAAKQASGSIELKAYRAAALYVAAGCINGMKLPKKPEMLIQRLAAVAGTDRQYTLQLADNMLSDGTLPARNQRDWRDARQRLADLIDAKHAGEHEEEPADKRPRWYLTDLDGDTSKYVTTFDRAEATEKQKLGWSVVGPEVDNEFWKDEKSGHFFRQFLDGTYGRIYVNTLNHWKREANREEGRSTPSPTPCGTVDLSTCRPETPSEEESCE